MTTHDVWPLLAHSKQLPAVTFKAIGPDVCRHTRWKEEGRTPWRGRSWRGGAKKEGKEGEREGMRRVASDAEAVATGGRAASASLRQIQKNKSRRQCARFWKRFRLSPGSSTPSIALLVKRIWLPTTKRTAQDAFYSQIPMRAPATTRDYELTSGGRQKRGATR